MTGLLTTVCIKNKEYIVKELKLKDYKTILKCLVSDPIDVNTLFLNLNTIIKKLTNLTSEQISNLNLLEYLLLLLHIRITSIGNSIFGVYKNDDESINVEISLNKTQQEVKECLNTFKPITYKTLTTSLPTIKDIITDNTYPFIIQDVKNLPFKKYKDVTYISKEYNAFFKNFYFFKSPIEKYSIKLNLQIKEYCQLIKILFNENLLTLYDNIYYLCKFSQLTPNYLENCTYGEFKIFVKKTEEILYKNTPPASETSQEPLYDPVDINSLYGNDDIPVTRSEFTP